MILAIDVGNTHIVLGCLEDGRTHSLSRLTTDPVKTEYEYAVIIRDVLSFDDVDCETLEGAIISSVVPAVTNTLRGAVRLLCGKEPLVVGAGIKTGLNIRIDNPAQLGADLAVGAVAALSLCPPPLIVIDMGTATTITAIDKDGAFRGGAISPGVVISMNALAGGTAQLPDISIEAPKHCIGTNTITCMQSGAIYGAAAMLDGMIERMEEELGTPCTVIATGGLSSCVIPHCRREIRYEPELLLHGLKVIWEKNKK